MKAALYCRLSEEDRNKQCATDDSNSIQNQKAMLLQYATEMGWEVYQIYSDDDYTGSDRRRPEFVRLLKDAEQRKFDIVLCKTQSRFTRELELVEKYIHGLFPIWGIRFVSIVDNADTANKGNKKSRQINEKITFPKGFLCFFQAFSGHLCGKPLLPHPRLFPFSPCKVRQEAEFRTQYRDRRES